jgi:hypothetical protein
MMRGKMACQRSMTHSEKERKMVCQRSMTNSEEERKDGVPKKYDPKKRVKKMAYQRSTTQKNGWRDNQSRKKELSSILCTVDGRLVRNMMAHLLLTYLYH